VTLEEFLLVEQPNAFQILLGILAHPAGTRLASGCATGT
jgi:hypothetical protein